ncbi:WD40/YVTN/BNR-like repeat-containing protein [Cytobacillus horneckiae]|uniref:WD40/YVTN/BNR-like repeat-containing protein n=1 Tax=Cytobacillus horneckiae TaxID=549687 RepID=UPI003D9A5417
MKNFIIIVTSVIIMSLIIGTVYFQKSINGKHPPLSHKIVEENGQSSPGKLEQPQSDPLQSINNETISYSLQNNELNITLNKGKDWVRVPLETDQLFDGEYNGNKQQLIDGSYILNENRLAFLYSEGPNWDSKKIVVTYSINQGKTWEHTVVTDSFPPIRFRKVDFLNNHFGYVIISGDRTMSQEFSTVFLTNDGGKSWTETNHSGNTRLISDGGFIDESLGFLSFGTINPEEPDLYLTKDGGQSWESAVFRIPDEYQHIFVSAEIPFKEGDHLAVLVNQGPNGDYDGGKVKGKFTSEDNGKTWDFAEEVKPNEAE